jgi:hypothetical protein
MQRSKRRIGPALNLRGVALSSILFALSLSAAAPSSFLNPPEIEMLMMGRPRRRMHKRSTGWEMEEMALRACRPITRGTAPGLRKRSGQRHCENAC